MIPGIVAGGLGSRVSIENLVPLGLDKSTKYYRFQDDRAYSYGPSELGEPLTLDTLRVWECYQDGVDIILKNSDNEYTVVEDVPPKLNNISLTFDQNGFPLIVWEINKQIFLRWHDPVINDTVVTQVANGYSPFIALETFNELLKPTRIILLVYISTSGDLVHRYQSDRWNEVFLIKEDVKDIIGFGPTPHNNIKIVYVNDKNVSGEYEIESIATERLGLYEFDTLHARNITAQLTGVTYTDNRLPYTLTEFPTTNTVSNGTSTITIKTYTNVYEGPFYEYPPVNDIISCTSSINLQLIGWHRLYPEDTVEPKLQVLAEMVHFNIRNAAITLFPEDIVAPKLEVLVDMQNIEIISSYIAPENQSHYSLWSFANREDGIVLSNDKKTALVPSDALSDVDGIVKSVVARSSYKKYVELVVSSLESGDVCSVGIARTLAPTGDVSIRTNDTWEIFSDGVAKHAGVDDTFDGFEEGDVIGIALDIETGDLWFSVNGTWVTGNPETGVDPLFSGLEIEEYRIISSPYSKGTRIALNVSPETWTHSAPIDYESWLENTLTTLQIQGDLIGGTNFESFSQKLSAVNAVGGVRWSLVEKKVIGLETVIESEYIPISWTSNWPSLFLYEPLNSNPVKILSGQDGGWVDIGNYTYHNEDWLEATFSPDITISRITLCPDMYLTNTIIKYYDGSTWQTLISGINIAAGNCNEFVFAETTFSKIRLITPSGTSIRVRINTFQFYKE